MRVRLAQMRRWQKGTVALLTVGMFAASLLIFYIQSLAKISSDLLEHIDFALEDHNSYSMMHLAIKVLHGIWSNSVLLCVFLAGMSVLSLWAGWALLSYLAPNASPMLLFFVSLGCSVEMPLFIPNVFPYYLGSYGAGIWHNPTFMLLKPLAVLSLLSFLKIRRQYFKKMPWKQWGIFTLTMTLATWAKPNFLVSFAPAVGILLLVDLIRSRGKALAKVFMLGLGVIPSVLVALMQSLILFGESGGIAFQPLMLLNAVTAHPVIGLLRSLVFPLLAVLLCFFYIKKSAALSVAALNAVFAFALVFCMIETGSRAFDGNFLWGGYIAVYVLFLVCAAAVCQWQAEQRVLTAGILSQKVRYWVLACAFVAHVAAGAAFYFCNIFLRTFLF